MVLSIEKKGQNSYLKIQGSLNISKPVPYYAHSQEGYIPSPRGHFSFNITQNINDNWRLNTEGNFVSDKTYLGSVEKLKLPGNTFSSPFLESRIEGERFSTRDYLNISGFSYQGLYDTNTNNVSFMIPSVTYHFNSDPHYLGHLEFESNLLAIKNLQETDYKRLILIGSWQRPHLTNFGQMINVFASLRGDIYRSEDPHDHRQESRKNTLRGFPQCGIQTSWPLMWNEGSLISQPFLHLILAPYLKKKSGIPVGDSQGFEYNDSVLLRKNRSPGYDQIDSGSRIVYGSHFLTKAPVIDDVHIFVGQTYMTSEPNLVMKEGGLRKGFSNIVGSVMANPYEWFSLDYRFSLNKNTFKAQFSEFSGHIGTDFLRLNIGYTRLESPTPTSYLGKEEAIAASLSSHFHKNWGGKIEGNYDIARDQLLKIGGLLIYQNDCFMISGKISRTFFHSKDIQPDNQYLVSFGLKNILHFSATIPHMLRTKHNPAVSTLNTSIPMHNDPLQPMTHAPSES